MGLRDKANVNSLRDKFVKDKEKKKNKGKGDKRFLNYFDMEEGQKMTIRFLPDAATGTDYWVEYGTHGPNLKLRGLESINCAYTSSGEDCPACAHSFDFHDEGNKKEAGRWRRKETLIAQCIVVDSPIEINESEDGNPIKLMYLPFSVKEKIEEAVVEGIVDVPMDFDFVLKKGTNEGGYASYDKSYFLQKSEPLDDEIIDAIDNGDIVLYNLSEEVPEATTTEDVEAWMEKALEADKKNTRRKGSSSSKDDDDDDEPVSTKGSDDDEKEEAPKKTSASALLNRLKKKDQ